jgi:hypothetical protein
MLNQILETLSGALATALVAIIGIVGKNLWVYIGSKIKKVQIETGTAKYNSELNFAQSVWGIVDEYFRITPNVTALVGSKTALFETEILKKCPYLTKDEIDHLRQAVAGLMNQGKAVVTVPAPEAVVTAPTVLA